MDLYLFSLLLGGIGLGAMALTGMGRHGGGSHGNTHATGGGRGHGLAAGARGHVTGAGASHGPGHSMGLRGTAAKTGHASSHGGGQRAFLALTSPRTLFSVCLGFGAVGLALHPLLEGPLRFLGQPMVLAAALVGGIAFERFIVTPIWNASLKFASEPALTLESCVSDEATAVTSFDGNGQGIVAIEMDGQVVQILGTLQPADREMGVRVHAGERVRIEEVDAQRNRCTVSLV